jgi:hypothetical protein
MAGRQIFTNTIDAQLRLEYDADSFADFEVDVNGDLAIIAARVGIGVVPTNKFTVLDDSGNAAVFVQQDGAGDLLALVAGANEFRVTNSGEVQAGGGVLEPTTEGDWIPAFVAAGGGTITGNVLTGSWIKIGRKVTVHCVATVLSVSSPLGELQITGLPFINASGNKYSAQVSVRAGSMAAGATGMIQGFIRNNTSTVAFNRFEAGAEADLAPHIQAGSFIQFTATYFTV